jgi:hypothetical protein
VRSPEFSPPPNTRKHKTSFSSIDESQSNLESYSVQRKRHEKAIESEQQREERLAGDRLRKRTARERDSQNQRNIRLANQQRRSVRKRLCRSEGRSSLFMNRQQRSDATESMDRQQHRRKPTEVVNMQREQQLLEKEQQALLNQYVWPTAIPTQLKEYCLQDFYNHMSMPVLRQSTCIICNIRASANTMKECALQDIPSLDKLSCHADLMGVIPQTQQGTQGKYFNRVITLLYNSHFEKGWMNIQTFSLYRTQSSTKQDIIQQRRLVTSVNNATVHWLKIRSQCSL